MLLTRSSRRIGAIVSVDVVFRDFVRVDVFDGYSVLSHSLLSSFLLRVWVPHALTAPHQPSVDAKEEPADLLTLFVSVDRMFTHCAFLSHVYLVILPFVIFW